MRRNQGRELRTHPTGHVDAPRRTRTESRRQPVLRELRLEGRVCALRPLRSEDATVAFPLIHGQQEILEWLVWRGPESVAELEDFYAHWRAIGRAGCNYHLAVVDGATRSFCGSISLRFAEHPGIGDLGYWLGRSSWGRGIGSEAIRLCAHLAFRQLDAEELRAIVFVGNDRSRRALEGVGFDADDGAEPFTCPDGRRVMQWSFRLSRQNFLERYAGIRPERETVELE